MVNRNKRLIKGIESLQERIEEHFKKIEEDIADINIERGRYHASEIDRSLIKALEDKIKILELPEEIINEYRERLAKVKEELDKLE